MALMLMRADIEQGAVFLRVHRRKLANIFADTKLILAITSHGHNTIGTESKSGLFTGVGWEPS